MYRDCRNSDAPGSVYRAQVGLGLADHYGVIRAVHAHMVAITLGGTCVFAGLVYLFRSGLLANTISRNAVALLSVGWLLGDLFSIGAWVVGMTFEEARFSSCPGSDWS